MTDTPPPPDYAHRPSYSDQRVVDVLYSATGEQRAVLTQDGEGLFRVHIEWWDTSEWAYVRLAQWVEQGRSSFADSIDRARLLGKDALT